MPHYKDSEFVLFTKYHKNEQMTGSEMGKACSTQEETRNACKISFGHPEQKLPLGRHKRIWEDNIKIDGK
jgi:hypothetical protein